MSKHSSTIKPRATRGLADSWGGSEEQAKLHLVHKCAALEVFHFEDTLAIVNGWYFTRYLGGGLTGDVYMLTDESEETTLVVKVVDKHRPTNEFSVLSAINSPRVVKLVDVFESPSYSDYFIVMQHVAGSPLGVVDNTGMLTSVPVSSPETLRPLARECCQAVAAVHEAGFAHLNIKPDHFIVDHKSAHVVLVNFGSATKLNAPVLSTSLPVSPISTDTAPQQQLTAYFLPPKADGLSPATLDIWALGVCLYTVAFGHVPFGGQGFATVPVSPTNGFKSGDDNPDLVFPASFRHAADASPDSAEGLLRSLLLRMLHTDPAARPSLSELLAHRFLAGKAGDQVAAVTFAEEAALRSTPEPEQTSSQAFQYGNALLTQNDGMRKGLQRRASKGQMHAVSGDPLAVSVSGGTQGLLRPTASTFVSKDVVVSDKLFLQNGTITRLQDERLLTRVLLCEHHLHTINALKQIIKLMVLPSVPLRIDSCRTAKEAVNLAQRFRYKLVIISTRLLDSSGLKAAQDIRNDEGAALASPVPIIAVGSLEEAVKNEALESGCLQGVMAHPVSVTHLREMLKTRGVKVREEDEMTNDLSARSEEESHVRKGSAYLEYLTNGAESSPADGGDAQLTTSF